MATHVSLLMLRSPPGRLSDARAQFNERRVFETCRDVVPGFVSARMLRSESDPDLVCVLCEWESREAWEQWMNSPQRNQQVPDRLFEATGPSALFEQVQELHR